MVYKRGNNLENLQHTQGV